jgi:hypothetical protein
VKSNATQMKLKGAGLALAIALLAPAAADGTSTGDRGPARTVRNSAFPRATMVAPRSLSPARPRQIEGASERTGQQPVTVTRQGGFGWLDVAVAAGVLIGIVLFGLWGDVAVGALIVGVAVGLNAVAKLVTRRPQGVRAWSSSGPRRNGPDGRSVALWPAPEHDRR